MAAEVDEKELKAAGAEVLSDGRRGLRIRGWEIESSNRSILNSRELQLWEEKLQTSHFPEMIFGNSYLILKHEATGVKIHFNAFDALTGWKLEALPPVEVPAAAKWKFRSKPFQEVILDYDYTFTTPYCGSEMVETNNEQVAVDNFDSLQWEDCEEKIDVVALASKEPILFYDEVVLYEDELADNGVSLLTVKVRVMPSGWFLLLRFWLRVDGVLMRLRDTRMHCIFNEHAFPVILRESCWRESTFNALAAVNLSPPCSPQLPTPQQKKKNTRKKGCIRVTGLCGRRKQKGYQVDAAAYNDPSTISQRLPIVMHKTQKLKLNGSL